MGPAILEAIEGEGQGLRVAIIGAVLLLELPLPPRQGALVGATEAPPTEAAAPCSG